MELKNPEDCKHMMLDDDQVNSPAHYTKGKFEVIDVIEDNVEDPYSYYKGNALKYLLRHEHKGKPAQDLKKAKWYIDRMIAKLEAQDD